MDPYLDYMQTTYGKAQSVNPWLAVSNFLSSPAKGKTIYETTPKAGTKNAMMISGGIIVVGIVAVLLLSRK